MIYAASTLVGIDYQIYLLQFYLQDALDAIWTCEKSIYNRLYETERNGTNRLEANIGKRDYVEPFVNDNKSCVVGVRVNDRTIDNHRLIAGVDIIFTVNVQDALGTKEYQDEKVLMQAYRVIRACGLVNNLTEIKTGIENVFTGIDTDNIKHRDLAPFMAFAFTCEMTYIEELC